MERNDGLQQSKVGDKVWFSDVNRRGLQEVVVTKVGTKLITVGMWSGLVFRKESGRTNDNFGHQKLILDRDAYDAENVSRGLMQALYRSMSNYPEAGVSAADIRAAAELLKLEI